MSRRNKGSGRNGEHRKYRQKLDLDGAVVAGDPRLGEVVYCYRFPSHPGRVKIGYSSRGLTRVVEQSTAFPEKPEVVFVIHDKRAKIIEGAFHQALAGQQSDVMGTEWFDAGWSDFLRISPILRKALRMQGRHRIRRFSGYLALAGVGLCLYPPLALMQIAMAQNVPPDQLANIWSGCFDIVFSSGIQPKWELLTYALKSAWVHPMPMALKAIPVAVASLPLLLPQFFRKKQAY